MKTRIGTKIIMLGVAALLFVMATSCEIGTHASGTVSDSVTGLPIDSVHVTEIAVHKKEQTIVADGYTDSTGRFDINGGLAGFGPRKTTLILLVSKEGYFSQSMGNEYIDLNIRLRPR